MITINDVLDMINNLGISMLSADIRTSQTRSHQSRLYIYYGTRAQIPLGTSFDNGTEDSHEVTNNDVHLFLGNLQEQNNKKILGLLDHEIELIKNTLEVE